MPDRRDGGTPRHRFLGWILLFVVVGLATRLVLQRREWTLATDSFQYILLARSLGAGDGYVSGGGQHPDVTRPPLYPVTVAETSLVTGDPRSAADLVAALAGALLALPLALLARDLFGERAGYAAAPLAALSCLTAASCRAMPTTLFALIGVAAAHAAYRAAKDGGSTAWMLAGALGGLAPLARTEGLAWPFALVGWILVATPRGASPGRFRRAAGCLAVAAAVYAPYAAYASVRLGRFAPVPGLTYLQDIRSLSDRLGLRYVKEGAVDWTERSRFLLSRDHRSLVLETYFERRELLEPDPEEAGTDVAHGPETGVVDSRAAARRRFGIILRNEMRVPRYLYWNHFAPPVFLALAAIGSAAAIRRREGWIPLLFLGLAGAVSLVPAMSHLEPRFFYPVFGFGLALAAAGWGVLAGLVALLPGGRGVAWAFHGALLVAVALEGLRHPTGSLSEPAREPVLTSLAEAARPTLPEGRMLGVQPAIPYLAGRPYRALPLGSPADVLEFGAAQGARSLAFEGERDLKRRPDLAALLADPPPPGFRLLAAVPHPEGGEARIFVLDPPGGLPGAPDAIVPAENP